MLRRLWSWLGAERAWALAILLVGMLGGIVAAQVLVDDANLRLSVQLAFVWVFVAALGLALSSRVTGPVRQRLWLTLGPGLILLAIGILLPPLALFFGGGGLGWMVAAQFVLRGSVRMEYQSAIKYMRAGNYDQAIEVMDRLIRAEPNAAEHYRFRAELFRLGGKPDKAIKDYRRVTRLAPDALAGYAGLAETALSQGDLGTAQMYALQALERDSGGWMAAYNLGMIADRRGEAGAAVDYLARALDARIPQSRYRLMARLWLARNYVRLGRRDDAQREVERIRKESAGLREWEAIMQSEEAASLRDLLAEDVALARELLESPAALDLLDHDR